MMTENKTGVDKSMKETYRVLRGDGAHWDNIPRAELKETGWLEPAGVKAWMQLCHDGENLYVRLEAQESPIRATLTGTLDQVCNDSCLEFFFAPLEEDARYFNFEWNPLKSLNLGFGGTRPTRVHPGAPDRQEDGRAVLPPELAGGEHLGHHLPHPRRVCRPLLPRLHLFRHLLCQRLQVRR